MKFMLLVHHNETAFEQMSEEERARLLAESIRLTHELYAKGQYLGASPLHPTSTATVVRIRDGKTLVTDGPFVETREQLAGYFLVEAKDQADAAAIAMRVPGARIGNVEVRPVKEVEGLPG
jgi:hypothetical protein